MKIKKWKELLTGIALVGAITPAISLSVNKNNTTQTTTSLSVLKKHFFKNNSWLFTSWKHDE